MELDSYKDFNSVAIFGSNARNDNDSLSDRDLLVVTEMARSSDDFNSLKLNGYSPSAYTWRTLETLSKNGALFLIHLKRESIILKDDGLRLQNLLQSTVPAKNYQKTINESVYLAELTFNVPDDAALRLWAADVLAVAFRNFMIAYAATNGVYLFSYGALIENSVQKLGVTPEIEECLYKLREWKSLYRGSNAPKNACLPTIREIHLIQSFFKSRKVDNQGEVYSKCNFIKNLLELSELKRPWYHKLRLFEGIYRSINQSCFNSSEVFEIERLISSPSFYSNSGQISWKMVKSLIERKFQKSLD